jgi:hypothetical protein
LIELWSHEIEEAAVLTGVLTLEMDPPKRLRSLLTLLANITPASPGYSSDRKMVGTAMGKVQRTVSQLCMKCGVSDNDVETRRAFTAALCSCYDSQFTDAPKAHYHQ